MPRFVIKEVSISAPPPSTCPLITGIPNVFLVILSRFIEILSTQEYKSEFAQLVIRCSRTRPERMSLVATWLSNQNTVHLCRSLSVNLVSSFTKTKTFRAVLQSGF